MTKPTTDHISSQPANAPVHNQQGAAGTFARIFWALIGNAIAFFAALGIFLKPAPFFSLGLPDAIYWVTVLLLVVIRYCDIKYLNGLTAQGQPASMIHWRKYVVFLLLIAAGVWLVAHGLGFLNK